MYTTIFVSFISGGWADEVADDWEKFHWYEYDIYFFSVIHWQSYMFLIVKNFDRLSEKLDTCLSLIW